jgi:hypothetical protein
MTSRLGRENVDAATGVVTLTLATLPMSAASLAPLAARGPHGTAENQNSAR